MNIINPQKKTCIILGFKCEYGNHQLLLKHNEYVFYKKVTPAVYDMYHLKYHDIKNINEKIVLDISNFDLFKNDELLFKSRGLFRIILSIFIIYCVTIILYELFAIPNKREARFKMTMYATSMSIMSINLSILNCINNCYGVIW